MLVLKHIGRRRQEVAIATAHFQPVVAVSHKVRFGREANDLVAARGNRSHVDKHQVPIRFQRPWASLTIVNRVGLFRSNTLLKS